MAEEKDWLETVEFSELTEEQLKEITEQDKELRPDIIQGAVSVEMETQAAISESIKSPQELMLEKLQAQKSRFKQPLTDEQIDKELADWTETYRKAHEKEERPSFVVELLTALLPYLAPLLTAAQQAAIYTDKNISQPLRKEFRPALMDLERVLMFWLRNKEYEPQLKETLARYGFEDVDIDRMKKLTEILPGTQDLITFAVREAFNPEAIKTFQLDAEMDIIKGELEPLLDKIGMPWDTFKYYWRSHWVLPGIREAFEMLHRKQIKESDIDVILKAQDVMPRFRDPLKAIAYSPLTRVDIRRIQKTLTKDIDWVKEQYEFIGYNEDNAQTMANFTMAYNKDPAFEDILWSDDKKNKERDLTKSDVLNAYKQNMILRTDTKLYLKDLGYDDDEAELLIDRIDEKREQDIIDLKLKTWKRGYLNGVYDRITIISLLDSLELPTQYRENLLTSWDVDKIAKTERPSKSELIGFYKRDIISEPELKQELSELGYSDKYIGWYLLAAQTGETNA